MPRRDSAPVTALALVALLLVGCASDDDRSTVDRWFDVTRDIVARAEPSSDVMRIDPTSSCALVDEVAVEDRALTPFGAGVARFGDIGERYQCAWTGDEEPAVNVRLEVVVVDRQPDFADWAAEVPMRDGNEVVSTEAGVVQVASFTSEETDRTVTTAVLVLPAQRGGVQLVVEATDPDADPGWSAETVAGLLASAAV